MPESIRILLPEKRYIIHYSIIALDQILTNLLSNAIRYNDKTEGLIIIRFSEHPDHYLLEIEDNGIGIPEQYLEKIFATNFTLGQTDRFNSKGNGIGLSTVKDLLYILNSSISVNSVKGEGSTFTVKLSR